MPRYRVYGSDLESDLEFPGLASVAADAAAPPPRWRFRSRPSLAPMRDERLLGSDPLYRDVSARLYEHRDGWRIIVDDTGAFDLAENGEILVAPRADAWDDFLRAHLLGRVLALAMYREGWMPFHASAVSTREGVIAFLGPKGVGKSSLATAFVAAGTPLVTDDTLPVDPSTPPLACPGIHMLRVRTDAHEALALDDRGSETREGKREVALTDARLREEHPQPLAALFLLAPVSADAAAPAVRRKPLAPAMAAAALLGHVKGGQMLGPGGAASMLARVATLVHLVPVHQLHLVRDLSRLHEAVNTVLDWYGGVPTG